MSIAGGVISILDWLKDKLPIAGRLEGIKNEIDKLEKEQKELKKGNSSIKNSKRMAWIDDRLDMLYRRFAVCNTALLKRRKHLLNGGEAKRTVSNSCKALMRRLIAGR